MNPTISIILTVRSATEAIEAYKAIVRECGPVATVSLSSTEERQDAEDMKQASKVQSSGCGSTPKVSEEQELREEYRSKHPKGKGFRLTREQIASGAQFKGNPEQIVKAMGYLRDAVEQLRAGTFVATQEDNEPDTSLDDGDIY